MTDLFYIAAAAAVVSTLMVITSRVAVHALLYLIVSLLSIALVFFSLGAPCIAALEVIIYAGAVMVLFIFVIMMLNIGPRAAKQEGMLMEAGGWIGPVILAALLLAELLYVTSGGSSPVSVAGVVEAKQVGMALFGPYVIGVELASLLLLAGLVGAFHLGRKD